MSIVEMRAAVHEMIDEVDSKMLSAIYAMLGAYQEDGAEDALQTSTVQTAKESTILGYDADGKPLYVKEARELFKSELEGVKRGGYMTIEEFEKESETW